MSVKGVTLGAEFWRDGGWRGILCRDRGWRNAMTLDQITAVFGWMTVLNAGLYTLQAGFIIFAPNFTLGLQKRVTGWRAWTGSGSR